MIALPRTASTGDALRLLLDRLEGVKPDGKKWRAMCPACGGRSRKVSVTEGDDGRVLLHCFAGCAAADVVQALGLTLADLYPERITPRTPEEHRLHRRQMREVSWLAALEVIEREAAVIEIAGRQISSGVPLLPEDSERLSLAVQRVQSARMVLRAR